MGALGPCPLGPPLNRALINCLTIMKTTLLSLKSKTCREPIYLKEVPQSRYLHKDYNDASSKEEDVSKEMHVMIDRE